MGSLVVLAYSGGLDTSAIVPWLGDRLGAKVLCYVANVGQGEEELDGIEAKALCSGAVGCVVDDLREEFIVNYVFPTLRAGAVYARTYLLGTAMARPAIAAGQVAVAQARGATALAHGCTGKGNDQIRIELTYQALAPDLEVIAPWRSWDFKGRSDLLTYLKTKGIDVAATFEKPFSRDRNLWHVSHEGGVLEDPAALPPDDLFMLTVDPAAAPDSPDQLVIEFDQGIPVAIDSVPRSPVELVSVLNDLAGAHGIGREDVVEDRVVGMKSRGVYETPAGTVLRAAHRALEQLVLDRTTLELKDQLAPRYADLVYEGRWWSQERDALDALVNVTQERVTGNVTLKLFKGAVAVLARHSPFSLYSAEHATFDQDEVYDSSDATGFIKLFGLSTRITSRVKSITSAAPVK